MHISDHTSALAWDFLSVRQVEQLRRQLAQRESTFSGTVQGRKTVY